MGWPSEGGHGSGLHRREHRDDCGGADFHFVLGGILMESEI